MQAAHVDSDKNRQYQKTYILYGKTENDQNILIIYDLETFNTDRAIPYTVSCYPVSKSIGKYDRDLTNEEIEKCRNDTYGLNISKK